MNLSNFLTSLTPEVEVASLGIVVVAAGFWFFWTPRLQATLRELRTLQRYFLKSDSVGREAISQASDQTTSPNIRAILREIQSGLFDLPTDFGRKTYSLRFFQDLWTPRALLAKRVNLALYEAAPNILIGVGLLFTFVFLAFALADVIPALNANSSPDTIRNAIGGLLKNAAGKFLTSISGMTCSLLWTYASKRNLEVLEDEIEALCVAMQRHVEDTGSEAAIASQISLLGEILTESREQVGQLKRFETDFAVAIGQALGTQMQPAFESLAHSITTALQALTEKVGSMNEEALGRMLADFQSAIRDQTGKEMEIFRQTLLDISRQIKDAATQLEGAGGQAGQAIEASGKAFTEALAGGAGDLRQAAGLLEQAMVSAKATVNDLDATLERAASEGRDGFQNLQTVLARLASMATEVGTLVATIQGSAADFKSAASSASTAADGLRASVTEQSQLVNTVSTVAQSLGQSLTSANNEFKNSAQTLSATTQSITAGVEHYSQQVSQLHRNMDENLAKAIGSLNSTISELVDGLDDFLEEVGKVRR